MSSLNTIKDLINNRFSDGRNKMPASINPNMDEFPVNGITLYYQDDPLDNSIIALGSKTQIGLYSQGVQIAVWHDQYDKARDVAFQVLEYINANLPTGIVMIPLGSPTYAGINQARGQHVYTIIYDMKGDK